MDALQVKLAQVRDRIAHLQQLLADRAAAGEAAQALLAQESTPPRRRPVIESELLEAELDVVWIRTDLAALVSRERVLEADLAYLMAEDVELRAAEAARAAKAAKVKGRAKQCAQDGEINRAADARSQENPAPTGS